MRGLARRRRLRGGFGAQAFAGASAFNANIGAWNTAAVTTLNQVCDIYVYIYIDAKSGYVNGCACVFLRTRAIACDRVRAVTMR